MSRNTWPWLGANILLFLPHMPLVEAPNQWDREVPSILVNLAKGREKRKSCRQIIQLTSVFFAAWCILATKFWPMGCEGEQCVQPSGLALVRIRHALSSLCPSPGGHGGIAAVTKPRGRWHSCPSSSTSGLLHICHLHCWIFAYLLGISEP